MNKTLNGVGIDQLVATVNAIKDNPSIARFQFRSNTEWVDGGHSRTKIQDQNISVNYKINSNAPRSKIEELCE